MILKIKNSRTNSVYVVKPKMHGPEVAFTNTLFEKVEQTLGIKNTQLRLNYGRRKNYSKFKRCINGLKKE